MNLLIAVLYCIPFFGLTIGQDTNCPPDGNAILPLFDCTRFILCENGNRTELVCDPLYFNEHSGMCDWPENVPDCSEGKRVVLRRCGQTLNHNYGAIEYKLNETYDAGELCVFILRHNYSSNPGFRFLMETHGINELDQNSIAILSLGLEHQYATPYLRSNTNYLGPPYLDPILITEGYVAVVVFKTYSNSGTGFRLSFNATGDDVSIPEYNHGLDLIFKDEIKSPFELKSWSQCSAPACTQVFAFTSGEKLITDPAFFFKLSVTFNTLPQNTSEEYRTCSEIVSIQDQTFNWPSGLNDCWNERDEPQNFVFDGRGMFIAILTYLPGSNATGSINWEKLVDPYH